MLRKTIIVVALATALPSPPKVGGDQAMPPVADAGMFAYVTAAADTFTDMRGFCVRNPDVCVAANSLAGTMEAKAKYSARLIYEWANEAGAAPQAGLPPLPLDLAELDDLATGTAKSHGIVALSQSTLTLQDLLPEWKAPPSKS